MRTPASPCGRNGRRRRTLAPVPCGVVALATGDGEARDQALEVPLERSRKRLVEVVDVEREAASGSREDAEVREVRVAAELGLQAGAGTVCEVSRHDRGRATEERKRRDEHPPVPNRDELWHPRPGLLLQHSHRIRTRRGGLPLAVRPPRHLAAHGLAACRPFGGAEMRDSRAVGIHRLRATRAVSVPHRTLPALHWYVRFEPPLSIPRCLGGNADNRESTAIPRPTSRRSGLTSDKQGESVCATTD